MSANNGTLEKTVPRKRILAHCTIGIGQNLTFTFWSSYITMFYTDILGLELGAVASLTLVARLWDAINDPLMGVVADNTRTKWGKFRPWLLFAAGPIALFLVLSFTKPNFSQDGNLLYAWFTYLGMTTSFTLLDIPFWTMPSAYTENSNERTSILTYARLTTTICGIVGGISLPPLIKYFGDGDRAKGFFGVAVMIAIIGTICRLIGFFGVRELPRNEQLAKVPREKFQFKKTFQVIYRNKPLLMIVLAGVTMSGFYTLASNSMVYFAQYVLGDLNYASILQLVAFPCTLIGLVLTAPLAKRIGKKKVLIGANLVSAVINIAFFFVGYKNMTVLFIFTALRCFPMGMNNIIIAAMVADTVEYAEWKTGERSEGLINSSQTFMANVSLAVAGSIIPLLLGLGGYVPNAQQTEGTMNMIFVMQSLLPAAGLLLSSIPAYFYELTEGRHAEIVAELHARKDNSEQTGA